MLVRKVNIAGHITTIKVAKVNTQGKYTVALNSNGKYIKGSSSKDITHTLQAKHQSLHKELTKLYKILLKEATIHTVPTLIVLHTEAAKFLRQIDTIDFVLGYLLKEKVSNNILVAELNSRVA